MKTKTLLIALFVLWPDFAARASLSSPTTVDDQFSVSISSTCIFSAAEASLFSQGTDIGTATGGVKAYPPTGLAALQITCNAINGFTLTVKSLNASQLKNGGYSVPYQLALSDAVGVSTTASTPNVSSFVTVTATSDSVTSPYTKLYTYDPNNAVLNVRLFFSMPSVESAPAGNYSDSINIVISPK